MVSVTLGMTGIVPRATRGLNQADATIDRPTIIWSVQGRMSPSWVRTSDGRCGSVRNLRRLVEVILRDRDTNATRN